MDGHRHAVTSADGTEIGLLTAGDGPPLLPVLGGMGYIESWALTTKTLAVLDGQGHDAINQAPELLLTQLAPFFS